MLITPSTAPSAWKPPARCDAKIMRLRAGRRWFAELSAASDRIQASGGTEGDWDAIAPSLYGRWDAAAQAGYAAGDQETNADAARAFGAPGGFDPDATRAAPAAFTSPVLLLAGEVDVNIPPRLSAEFAGLSPDARLVIQPGTVPGWMTPTGSRQRSQPSG